MNWIFGNFLRGRAAVGLLIVRLVFGCGIMLHGWQKIHMPGGPFGWMGDAVPAILQGLAVLAEFGGGIGIMLGALTQLSALGLTCTMLVALFMVHIPHGDPFVASKMGQGSFEPAAGYLAVALLLLIAGPGCLSVDAIIGRMWFSKQGKSQNRVD